MALNKTKNYRFIGILYYHIVIILLIDPSRIIVIDGPILTKVSPPPRGDDVIYKQPPSKVTKTVLWTFVFFYCPRVSVINRKLLLLCLLCRGELYCFALL